MRSNTDIDVTGLDQMKNIKNTIKAKRLNEFKERVLEEAHPPIGTGEDEEHVLRNMIYSQEYNRRKREAEYAKLNFEW